MLQKDQVESYLAKTRETIEQALKELTDVKLVQQNDPTEYPFLMTQMVELDNEINDLLPNASPVQRQQLEEAQYHLRQTKTYMVRGF